MAQKRKGMEIQNEITRLKALGHSNRKIAKLLGINKDTVAKYVKGPLKEIETKKPDWVKALDWELVNKDLELKVPKNILYEELSENNKLPSYQAFCQYIRNNPTQEDLKSKVVVKIIRTPGESMEVDYSGDSVEILNPALGEIYRVELFVGALSYSGYFYCEFTLTQKQEDFIDSHNKMFRFFGGVAKYIIPDNCKTAVTKTDKYDPLVNKTYHDMCCHYNIAVDPADAYSPTHKPNVEKAVDIIQQDFFPRIRNKTFTSLVELNRELWAWLEKKNKSIMKDRGNSRLYFFEKEQHLLRNLPASNYELKYFKVAKVHPDCHFQHARNFYSVPYQYVGKEIDIKFNHKIVHAFYRTTRIAIHTAARGHGHYITNDAHYPEEKIVEINYHLNKARIDAKKIGPNMEMLIEKLIKMDRFPLKTLRKVQGVLGLKSSFDNQSLDWGAGLSLEFDKLTYRSVKNFSKNYKVNKEQKEKAPIRSANLICLQGGTNE